MHGLVLTIVGPMLSGIAVSRLAPRLAEQHQLNLPESFGESEHVAVKTLEQADDDREFSRLHARLRRERELALANHVQNQATDDETAYVPAARLRTQRSEVSRADQMNRFLKRVNDEQEVIRTRKPSKNRLLIHAGDWSAYWDRYDEMQFNALDDESVAKVIAEMESRKLNERRRK